jgi:TPR repeat protein
MPHGNPEHKGRSEQGYIGRDVHYMQGTALQIAVSTLTIIAGVTIIGLATWFALDLRRAMRRFGPGGALLIRRARQQRALQSIDGTPVDRLVVLALGGNAAAQYRLGNLYAEGRGLPRDEAKAVVWYQKAAAADFIDAQYCLALHYDSARGVSQDFEQARLWYEKAALGGHDRAQCNLAVLFSLGRGTSRNLMQAAYWWVNSAAQGNKQALENLAWLADQNGEVLSVEDRAALSGFRHSADQGDANALLLLGWLSHIGFAMPQSSDEARRYLERAQTNGHLFAHNLLAQLTSS